MNTALALCLSLTFASPAFAADPVFDFDADDPQMTAAIKAARAGLETFFAHSLDAEGIGVEGALLKVAIPIPATQGGNEHFWIAPFKRLSEDGFVGILTNEPVYVPDISAGDPIDFTKGQISDWAQFAADGTIYGGYTMRVTAALYPDQVSGYNFSETPLPADW